MGERADLEIIRSRDRKLVFLASTRSGNGIHSGADRQHIQLDNEADSACVRDVIQIREQAIGNVYGSARATISEPACLAHSRMGARKAGPCPCVRRFTVLQSVRSGCWSSEGASDENRIASARTSAT